MAMNSSLRRVSILSLLAVLAASACTERNPPLPVPTPDKSLPISDALRARIHLNERALADDGFAKTQPALERTLADIEREYGKTSVAVPQSLYQTALMIINSNDGSYRDAEPYLARAVDASVLAYGPMHRETAFAVNDYAYVQILAAKVAYLPAATPLYERALDIRRRVLGSDALETAGSEKSVADQLLRQCRSRPICAPDDPLLGRASVLAEHALSILSARLGETHPEISVIEALVDEIKRARGKPVTPRSRESQISEVPDGSCGKQQKHSEPTDLSWVQAKTPLYRLSRHAELSVGGFDGRPWKTISKHEGGGSDWPELTRPMNGRWIAYSTRESANQPAGLWIFDTVVGAERRVDTPPVQRIPNVLFSPDGNSLGYFVSRHELYGATYGIGVHLVDTQSGRSTFAGYPSDTRLSQENGGGRIFWSADGSALLLHLEGYADKAYTHEFHRFDIHSRTFRKIDGDDDKTYWNDDKFVDHGREIPKHTYSPPGTNASYGGLNSPTGAWRARVDPQHRLMVSKGSGKEEFVEQGAYHQYEGVTISITGWVDDRYLVYRNEWRQIIFDPVSRRRALLFKCDEAANAYSW